MTGHVAPRDAVDELRRWIEDHHRVVVLTGAGCSTASGIPDYRDDRGEWKRRPPVMFQAFRAQESTYRRYWARAFAGWPRFTAAVPGAAHHALAAWERTGSVARLNVQARSKHFDKILGVRSSLYMMSWAGLPTIVVPFFGDQFFWGRIVADAGAGPEPIPIRSAAPLPKLTTE